jgi:hypothetical protein
MTSARCRNDVSGQVPGEGTARLCPHQAIPTAAEKPLPCLRTRRYCIGGISSNRLSLGITFFRALRDGPSPPLQRVLCRELCGPELGEHGAQPFRDFQPRDAWPLPRDGVPCVRCSDAFL